MKVTADVINDLLPLYSSGECSGDTKQLVEEFLKANPNTFPPATRAQKLFPPAVPGHLSPDDQMQSLARTRRRLKIRSSFMGLAIFFSLAPFSFLYTQGKFYSLISESPTAALIYGTLGVLCWAAYFIMRRRMKDL